MKRAFTILSTLFVIGIVAGCPGQQPVTPPVITYTCPTPGNGAYTLLAPASSSTTYTVSGVVTQTCYYIAQGVLGSQTGSWSNVTGPTVGGATGKVALSLTCTAGAGTTCTGVQWEFSSASATQVTALAPAVPSMGSPTTSEVIKPDKNISLRAKGL